MTVATELYDRQTAKFLARVAENMPELSSHTMQGLIQDPRAMREALRSTFCPPVIVTAQGKFKPWKTIRLGTHQSVDDLSKTLTAGGFRIGNYAMHLLKNTLLARTETDIELVLLKVSDLGFERATRRDAIYGRAEGLGLGLVSAEVGPQLRRQYSDQPMNERILVAMAPIAGSDGRLGVFRLIRDVGAPRLSSDYGGLDVEWGVDDQWVFASSRNAL